MQTIVEALSFVQDQKLGHYMKVPPRATFVAQLSATTVACFVQSGTKELLFHVVKDICTATQKSLLICSSTKVFFTSSIIWYVALRMGAESPIDHVLTTGDS